MTKFCYRHHRLGALINVNLRSDTIGYDVRNDDSRVGKVYC